MTASCSSGTLTATWEAAGAGLAEATGYKPRIFTRDTAAENWTMSTNWTADTTGHETTTATIPATGEPDLPDSGVFQLKVKATNAAGSSDFSSPVDVSCTFPDTPGGIEWQYTLWAWAYNNNGRSGVASVNCDTISDTWLTVECSGSGILKVRWDDPSGSHTAPSGYTGTITLVSQLLDGLVASYDEAYDSNNTSVEWGAIGAPESEYQVYVRSKNANGGPV